MGDKFEADYKKRKKNKKYKNGRVLLFGDFEDPEFIPTALVLQALMQKLDKTRLYCVTIDNPGIMLQDDDFIIGVMTNDFFSSPAHDICMGRDQSKLILVNADLGSLVVPPEDFEWVESHEPLVFNDNPDATDYERKAEAKDIVNLVKKMQKENGRIKKFKKTEVVPEPLVPALASGNENKKFYVYSRKKKSKKKNENIPELQGASNLKIASPRVPPAVDVEAEAEEEGVEGNKNVRWHEEVQTPKAQNQREIREAERKQREMEGDEDDGGGSPPPGAMMIAL